MDVFPGQIPDDVISLLRDNNIHYILVPNNMTQTFQPLDLTVNKHCKSYLKRLFSEWYAQQIENQLSLGKKVEEIKTGICLTTLKPLHAKWLVEYYNQITSEIWFNNRYHKWLESSGYIRCYKGWVFWAIINWSIRRYLTSCHRTWWIRIVLAGSHRSILWTYILMKKILNGSKVTTKMMLILNVTYLMT